MKKSKNKKLYIPFAFVFVFFIIYTYHLAIAHIRGWPGPPIALAFFTYPTSKFAYAISESLLKLFHHYEVIHSGLYEWIIMLASGIIQYISIGIIVQFALIKKHEG